VPALASLPALPPLPLAPPLPPLPVSVTQMWSDGSQREPGSQAPPLVHGQPSAPLLHAPPLPPALAPLAPSVPPVAVPSLPPVALASEPAVPPAPPLGSELPQAAGIPAATRIATIPSLRLLVSMDAEGIPDSGA
jgi:hypothetical protein